MRFNCSISFLWLATTFSLALLAPSALPAEEKVQIPLGVSSILSGPWAAWGQALANGLTLGNEDLGKPYALDIQDDASDPARARGIFQMFTSIKHMPLIIETGVDVLDAVGPIATKEKITVLTLGGMMQDILKRNPTIVSFYSLSDTEAQYLAPYLASRKDLPTVAIVHGTNPFGQAIGNTLHHMLESRGVKVTRHEAIPLDGADFNALVPRILRDKPSAIWAHLSENSLPTLLKQLRQQGYRGEIYVTYVLESEAVKIATGSALEGVYYTYPVESPESPRYRDFAKRYESRFGIPANNNAALGYDAIQYLDAAVKDCNGPDAACVLQRISKKGSWVGLAGKVIFSGDRSAVRPHGLKQFRNGEFQWVVRELSLDR